MDEDLFKSAALPEGDYAIVELLGHRTLIGRIAEVERFGTKMLQIEPIYRGLLLDPILHGGASIYCMVPCSREIAGAKAPTQQWSLPASIAATLPVEALSAPNPDDIEETPYDEDDDGQPF